MQKAVLKAYTTALHNAAISRKNALQQELAVGIAVALEAGPSKRLARAQLCEVYAAAGYKCREPQEIDYKSVYRRITASLALFEFIGFEDLHRWTEGLSRGQLLDAIVKNLMPLKLGTVNEVLLICEKQKPPRATPGRKAGTPIDSEHLHFVVPPGTTSEELLRVASILIAMANEKTEAKREEVEQTQAEMETA